MTFWDELLAPKRLAQELWEWTGERFERQRFDDVLQTARHVAAGLRLRGVGHGSVVPAVITNMPDATAGYVGIWASGAAIASLPIPARGMSIEGYLRQLDALCALAGSPFFLAEERFLQFMPPDAPMAAEGVGYRSLIETPQQADVDPPDPDATVFVQFSSGTTGEPRGVELSGLAMDAQMRMLVDRMRIDPERDVGYIWLPLSHDMGFFGCNLLAIYTGMRGIRSTPERFLTSPRSWFEDCAEMGVTVTAWPPSALHLAARAERAGGGPATPLRLRVCLVGAEPVHWDVLEAAADALAPRGLTPDAFTVAYGLAEATLAVTMGALERRPRSLHVDGDALANGRIEEVPAEQPGARRILSTGTPVGATEVEVDPLTSEIVVRSPSVARGYLRDPAATAARFHDGAVRTGDVGFVRDGELYVVGRSDDVLIVGGRNVYVHEVEAEMSGDRAIREGNCAIVEHHRDGRAQIGILAELASARGDGGGRNGEDRDAVGDRLRRIALERAGLAVDEIVFLDPGAFPKTPSGKVQRFRCRELLGRPR